MQDLPQAGLADSGMSASAGPGPDVPLWYYAINGQRLGPISSNEMTQLLLRGPYDPWMLVWRQGMLTWVAVSQVPELALPGVSSAPPPVPAPAVAQGNASRQARANCIGFMIAFVISCALLIPVLASGLNRAEAFICLFAIFAVLPGVYATIYIPLRFRVINALTPGYRIMGLISGIGLMVLCWGAVLMFLIRVA